MFSYRACKTLERKLNCFNLSSILETNAAVISWDNKNCTLNSKNRKFKKVWETLILAYKIGCFETFFNFLELSSTLDFSVEFLRQVRSVLRSGLNDGRYTLFSKSWNLTHSVDPSKLLQSLCSGWSSSNSGKISFFVGS